MKCWSGVNKVSWADRARTVLCRLAGKSGKGRVFLLARHGPVNNFAIFVVLNFERGEKLETAILSISILWLKDKVGIIWALFNEARYTLRMRQWFSKVTFSCVYNESNLFHSNHYTLYSERTPTKQVIVKNCGRKVKKDDLARSSFLNPSSIVKVIPNYFLVPCVGIAFSNLNLQSFATFNKY